MTLWSQVKGVFLAYVLPTYQSKRVQFLLFFLSSWQPEFVEDWLNTIVELVCSPSTRPIMLSSPCGA